MADRGQALPGGGVGQQLVGADDAGAVQVGVGKEQVVIALQCVGLAGTAAAYLALCRELKKRTDEDLQNNVIARFHDESQLNRLVAETPGKFRILPPDYCTPEETPTGHEAILVLQKSRCINVESVKGAARPQNFVQRKWEAFRLNWLPYLWLARDTLLRRRIDFKNDL